MKWGLITGSLQKKDAGGKSQIGECKLNCAHEHTWESVWIHE